uniref:Uncharacterized protein n=1 Tax=Anguilla anguilla TaxID=7936 RepID=A0A0E9TIV7_ANGAN
MEHALLTLLRRRAESYFPIRSWSRGPHSSLSEWHVI